MITDEEKEKDVPFDPLDMQNYRVEKLKKAEKKGFERWMVILGGPLAILAFLYFYYFADYSFLNTINPEILKDDSLKRFNELGME
ncbi:MAG TPA: hypothetical protein PKJ24_04725, partial [Prolixibacteraceae bacterium]|nr:hypothetical protein [Prolixibacteraceae bacterium]